MPGKAGVPEGIIPVRGHRGRSSGLSLLIKPLVIPPRDPNAGVFNKALVEVEQGHSAV